MAPPARAAAPAPASDDLLSDRVVVALDAGRGLAACYVVVYHLAVRHGLTSGPGVVLRFGQEAVLVFFLLSGFVIFANERHRASSPRSYFLRRLRRVYPVLLGAMLVSTLVSLDDGTFARLFDARELAATLLGLQDMDGIKPGVIAAPYMRNLPLWSLSYEMAFYAVFPLVLAGWTTWPAFADHVVGATCCALYASYALSPNHFALVGAYFLVWWAGATAARAYMAGGRSVLAMRVPFAWLLALCAVAAIVVAVEGYRGSGVYPFLPFRHFTVATALLAIFFGPVGAIVATIVQPFARTAGAVASVSYGLYVLHYPLLIRWERAQHGLGILLGLAMLVALAWLFERKLMPRLPRAPRD